MTSLAMARQIGANDHFDDGAAKRSFKYYGRIMYGWRFRRGPWLSVPCEGASGSPKEAYEPRNNTAA